MSSGNIFFNVVNPGAARELGASMRSAWHCVRCSTVMCKLSIEIATTKLNFSKFQKESTSHFNVDLLFTWD